jgi:hypothetical protein
LLTKQKLELLEKKIKEIATISRSNTPEQEQKSNKSLYLTGLQKYQLKRQQRLISRAKYQTGRSSN